MAYISNPIEFLNMLEKFDDEEEVYIVNEDKNKRKKVKIKDLKELHKNRIFSIAGDGRLYNLTQEGIMPSFLRQFFNFKVKYNNEIIKYEDKVQKVEGKEKKEYENKLLRAKKAYDTTKTILNSVYGQLGNRYSRWCSIPCASSVTASGRFTIYQSELFINKFFNDWPNKKIWPYWKKFYHEMCKKFNFYKSKKEFIKRMEQIDKCDRVVFVDTDSNGIVLGKKLDSEDLQPRRSKPTAKSSVVKKLFGDVNNNFSIENIKKDELIQYILVLCNYIQTFLNDMLEEIVAKKYYNSLIDFPIEQKQEIVAEKILVLGKKKYALAVVNKKGVPVNKLKVVGIELIKSNTAKCVKKPLEQILLTILNNPIEKSKELLKEIVSSAKKEIRNDDIQNIGQGCNLNNLEKFNKARNKPFEIPKSCPIHVRAALHHNDLIEYMNLQTRYQLIEQGNKIFHIPVKPKSTLAIKHNIVDLAFVDEFPIEFFEHVEIDYKRVIDKIFIDKIKIIVEKIGLNEVIDMRQTLINKLFKRK